MDVVKYARTNPAVIAYGLYLYFSSRSYRFASKSLEPIIKRTHVSIWKWVQKYSKLADPENELSKLKKRMYVAASGALILAEIWLSLIYPTLFSHIYLE